MDDRSATATLSVGGGTYILVAIGVGMAASSWGSSLFMSIIFGLFWPATVAYWLLRAFHVWGMI